MRRNHLTAAMDLSMPGEYKTATALEELRHNTNALQEFPDSAFSERREVPYGKGESQNSKAFNE